MQSVIFNRNSVFFSIILIINQVLELNKDRLLNLGQKNYKNLVEALTNNAIIDYSSNPTLSLPQVSSTLPSRLSQTDIYRTEEPEIYDDYDAGR